MAQIDFYATDQDPLPAPADPLLREAVLLADPEKRSLATKQYLENQSRYQDKPKRPGFITQTIAGLIGVAPGILIISTALSMAGVLSLPVIAAICAVGGVAAASVANLVSQTVVKTSHFINNEKYETRKTQIIEGEKQRLAKIINDNPELVAYARANARAKAENNQPEIGYAEQKARTLAKIAAATAALNARAAAAGLAADTATQNVQDVRAAPATHIKHDIALGAPKGALGR